jgi:hypothetical protein
MKERERERERENERKREKESKNKFAATDKLQKASFLSEKSRFFNVGLDLNVFLCVMCHFPAALALKINCAVSVLPDNRNLHFLLAVF